MNASRVYPASYYDHYEEDDIYYNQCHHGNIMHECDKCDAEIEARGGIDKCMNCGRYKYGQELTRDQVCVKPCRNPNEY